MPVGITRSQRKSKSEALRRLTLSAAKQRIVDSDDSMEESMDDIPGNTSELDEDDGSGTEMLASKPNTSSDTEQSMDRMSPSPTSAKEKSVLPAASEISKGKLCSTAPKMVSGPSSV